MRKREKYQSGSVMKSQDGRVWLGKYRTEAGKHKTVTLDRCDEMKFQEAKQKLWDDYVKAVNQRANQAAGAGAKVPANISMKDYIEDLFFPQKRDGFWRDLTEESRVASIRCHIIGKWGNTPVRSMNRHDIKDWFHILRSHRDPAVPMARETVNGLRWALKSIFDLAIADGVISLNPIYSGKMLVAIPEHCPGPKRPWMDMSQVKQALVALKDDLRERLVFELIVVAGMRVSEVFGLRRGRVQGDHVEVAERVCRRTVDKPKTANSARDVGMPQRVREDMALWLAQSPDSGPEGWVFPSETLSTPLGSENLMARYLRPKLKGVGLGWVDYRAMRRTHSSLMKHLKADPKLVADQQGHGVDTSLNVYTQTAVADRLPGLEQLSALVN